MVKSNAQQNLSKLKPLQNEAIGVVEKEIGYKFIISIAKMEYLHIKLHLKLFLINHLRKIFMLDIVHKLSQEAENVITYDPEMLLCTGPK